MKKNYILYFLIFLFTVSLFSCQKSSKSINRMQRRQEGIDKVTKEEELLSAIAKYETRIKRIESSVQKDGLWYKTLGIRYFDCKMYGKALECFENALQTYPDNKNLYYYMGVCAGYMAHASLDFEGEGDKSQKEAYLKKAEEYYQLALRIDSNFSSALYGLGCLYSLEFNQNDKAIPFLEAAFNLERSNTNVMMALARAYYCALDYEKSVHMYENVLSSTKDEKTRLDAKNNIDYIHNIMKEN